MTATVYLNGRFVSEPDATVSVYDGGWLHGAGLFETMRAENGRVFRLESHIERLRRSASVLLAELDRDDLPLETTFTELLERNGLRTARVRLTVTAGSVRAGLDGTDTSPTVCVTAAEMSGHPSERYNRGVAVVVCDYRLSPTEPTAGHKTTGYLPRLLGLRQAQQAGCMEALWFTTANRLAEGCISNVFVVRKGVLKTPPLDTPVLPGIARGIVLDAADKIGIEREECPLTIDDLLDADEVVLTNVVMQVMPVIRVEKRDIGESRVGPIARRLLEEFRRLVKEECAGV